MDSPVLVYGNTHIITFSAPANSNVWVPDQNNNATNPTLINPTSYLSNSEAILINGVAYTTAVVNSTAFTTTTNTTANVSNAQVRLAVNATDLTTLLSNTEVVLVDSGPVTINKVNTTTFNVATGTATTNTGYVYAFLQTSSSGANVNHLTDGMTPNTSPTERGWTLEMPGAQEVLVSLEGLLMPNIVASFATFNAAAVVNATGQFIRWMCKLIKVWYLMPI